MLKLSEAARRKCAKSWRKTNQCPHCGDCAKTFIRRQNHPTTVQCMMCGLVIVLTKPEERPLADV